MSRRIFRDPALARDLVRDECAAMRRAIDAVREREPEYEAFAEDVAGALATFASTGSPDNKAAGLGMQRARSDAELDELESMFAERSEPVNAEVATLADPAVAERLTACGYLPAGFEQWKPPPSER